MTDRLDHAIEEVVGLMIQRRKLVARIRFDGASQREVEDVRRGAQRHFRETSPDDLFFSNLPRSMPFAICYESSNYDRS